MLEGNVEIGQEIAASSALGHEFDDLVDMRVGIDVVQSHPGAEAGEIARQVEKPRPRHPLAESALRVFDVEAVGGRVLRDDKQLLHAGFHQLFSLA